MQSKTNGGISLFHSSTVACANIHQVSLTLLKVGPITFFGCLIRVSFLLTVKEPIAAEFLLMIGYLCLSLCG